MTGRGGSGVPFSSQSRSMAGETVSNPTAESQSSCFSNASTKVTISLSAYRPASARFSR